MFPFPWDQETLPSWARFAKEDDINAIMRYEAAKKQEKELTEFLKDNPGPLKYHASKDDAMYFIVKERREAQKKRKNVLKILKRREVAAQAKRVVQDAATRSASDPLQ